MSNLILIFICMMIGVGLQKLKSLPKDMHVSLNVIILYVSLPALTLLSIPKLTWSPNLLSLVLMPWIVFGLATFLFMKLQTRLGWSQQITGCLILCAGLGNTSFVGFPLIEAMLGGPALKYAILIDQAGTFLICSTLGIWTATTFSAGHIPKREIIKKVLLFPPFISFISALVLVTLNFTMPPIAQTLLERFASMLAPLALVSVGLQLKVGEIKASLPYLKWGLAYKLIIAPVVIFTLYSLLNVPQEIFQVALYESAMAPMITASIIAASYGLQPSLAGLMVGVGVPLSFITLSIWYFIL